MNGEHNGLRFSVTPRRTRDGGTVYDCSVMDMWFKPLWSHTSTDLTGGVLTCKRWIEGTDRSVGFVHTA